MTELRNLSLALEALLRSGSDDFAALVTMSGLDPASDFRNADLSGLDLRGEDLRAFDLRNAHMRSTLVEGARFNTTVSATQLDEAIRVGDGRPTGEPPRIAIIALGERGKEIARHIRAPDWYPSNGGRSKPYKITREPYVGGGLDSSSIYLAPVEVVPSTSRFDIVVVVADDDIAETIVGQRAGIKYPGLTGPGIRLLVPALPRDRPSAILCGEQPVVGPFHAVVDSSIARSPFWSGNPWRALDRRIADMAVGAAMLAGELSDVSGALVAYYNETSTPLMAFGFPLSMRGSQPQVPIVAGLSSEVVGIRPSSDIVSKRAAAIFMSEFHPLWHRQRPKDANRGIVELRQLPGDDPASLFLDVAHKLGDGGGQGEDVIPADLPRSIEEGLKYPDLAAGVTGFPAGPLAVISETPDVELVRAAAASGWRVARYTDVGFIAEVMSSSGETHLLPGEILLPPFAGWARNRGLATRGVDPRDVVPLKGDLLEEVQNVAPELLALTRGFRAAFVEEWEEEPVRVISTTDLAEWLASSTEGRDGVRARLRSAAAAKPIAPKRPADLRAAWSQVGPDMRFVVADGPVPVRVSRLAPDEVPAQSLFIVDGDEAVPALLQSSVFETWARATTTRSTSWMQRFSVGRTFETFPLSAGFTLGPGTQGGRCLRIDRNDSALASLAGSWLRRPPHAAEADAIRSRLDEAVLANYGLRSNATDLDIMERLLTLGTASHPLGASSRDRDT